MEYAVYLATGIVLLYVLTKIRRQRRLIRNNRHIGCIFPAAHDVTGETLYILKRDGGASIVGSGIERDT
jgi:hypothetical protein